MSDWIRKKIITIGTLDLRWLAVTRIGLGLVYLADLADRAYALSAFYTAQGVTPASLVLSVDSFWQKVTPYLFFDTYSVMSLVFLIHFIVGMSLVLGFKTRWSTFFAWVLFVFINNRNPSLEYGFDLYMNIFLFIGIFLPLGSRYSFDSRFHAGPAENRYFSIGTLAFVVQVAIIYLTAGMSKVMKPFWIEGSAVYYATKWSSTWASQAIDSILPLVPLLTWFALAAQFSAILLLTPSSNRRWRWISIVCLISTHVGIFIAMDIRLFAATAIFVLIGLIGPTKLEGSVDVAKNRFTDLIPLLLIVLISLNGVIQWGNILTNQPRTGWTDSVLRTLELKQSWYFFLNSDSGRSWFLLELEDEAQRTTVFDHSEAAAFRWYLYFEQLRHNTLFHESFAKYFCRYSKEVPVRELTLSHYTQNLHFGQPEGDTEKKVILRKSCLQ